MNDATKTDLKQIAWNKNVQDKREESVRILGDTQKEYTGLNTQMKYIQTRWNGRYVQDEWEECVSILRVT